MYRHSFFRRMIQYPVMLVFLSVLCAAPAQAAERCSVTGRIANIRSGPGTNHEILFQVEKYYPIQILEKSGNWYKIEDFEGDRGWIHKSLVGKFLSVITIKPKCHIRSGPGMKYQIKFICENGVPFKELGRKGNWIHVRHAEGYEGWMHKSLVW